MTRTILILALVPFLGGCGLDALEGKKSPEQVEHERREALDLEPAENVWDTPLQFADIPEPEPTCVEIWRSVSCVDGKEHEWVW